MKIKTVIIALVVTVSTLCQIKALPCYDSNIVATIFVPGNIPSGDAFTYTVPFAYAGIVNGKPTYTNAFGCVTSPIGSGMSVIATGDADGSYSGTGANLANIIYSVGGPESLDIPGLGADMFYIDPSGHLYYQWDTDFVSRTAHYIYQATVTLTTVWNRMNLAVVTVGGIPILIPYLTDEVNKTGQGPQGAISNGALANRPAEANVVGVETGQQGVIIYRYFKTVDAQGHVAEVGAYAVQTNQ